MKDISLLKELSCQLVIWDIGVFTLYLSHHDGKGMVNFYLAQTAGMAQTKLTNLAMVSGVWVINDTQ